MILKDKVVVISGVGPGLGRKLALLCADEGAKIAIGCRSTDFLEKLRAEVAGKGAQVVASPCDVSNVEQCQKLVNAAAEKFGRVDGLVNSAYQYAPAPFEEADLSVWARAMDVTCFGALRLAQAVVPHMKKVGGGSIVNVSTMETRKPRPGEGAYAIPKAALEMATRQLAFELGKYNIRVNSTLMGWMWGAPVENALKGFAEQQGASLQQIVDGVVAGIPIGRMPPDEECARSVAYFLSDYASVVTGALLNVNGGEYMTP
ncbi:MAG TPA: SDR family oxidoreductase [Alphaproteobacteria bacterium]|nr:SDR family oxidoreductase [Alphaproteobacteria bacterium]